MCKGCVGDVMEIGQRESWFENLVRYGRLVGWLDLLGYLPWYFLFFFLNYLCYGCYVRERRRDVFVCLFIHFSKNRRFYSIYSFV